MMYALVINAVHLNVSWMVFGEIGCILGFMTGNSNGVSTVPFLVSSLPILASKSLSRISKDMEGCHRDMFYIFRVPL